MTIQDNRIIDMHQDLYCATHSPHVHYRKQTSLSDIHEQCKLVHVSLWVEEQDRAKSAHEQREIILSQMRAYEDLCNNDKRFVIVKSHDEVSSISPEVTGLLLHAEGVYELSDPTFFTELYTRGLRSVGLVWNDANDIAVTSCESPHGRLHEQGVKLVERIIDHNCILDVAHLNHEGVMQVSDICSEYMYPFCSSHGGLRKFSNYHRTLIDEEVDAIAHSGGVVGVALGSTFLGADVPRRFIELLMYIRRLVGYHTACIGSDFGGLNLDSLMHGLSCTQDFSRLPSIFHEADIDPFYEQCVKQENLLEFYKRVKF